MLPSFNRISALCSLWLILSLFSGCASSPQKTVESRKLFILDDVPIELPPLSIVKNAMSTYVSQHASYNDEEYDFQNLIEFSPSKIEVTALSPFGVEIFNIVYSDNLGYSSALVPKSFNPAYILFDLMLIYLPIEDFARYLNQSGVTLGEKSAPDEKTRSLSYNGKTICVIVYRNDEIRFSNLVRSYSYSIKEIKE